MHGGSLRGITVAHWGHFDPGYPRNRIVAKALARAGARLVPFRATGRFLDRTPRLVRQARAERFDLLLVGFPGHSDVPAARAVARARSVPLVFDMHAPLWETMVDRARSPRISANGLRYRLTDHLAAVLSDVVLLDTDTHIDWVARDLHLRRDRFRRVWVGSDEEIMRPAPPRDGPGLEVLFWGTFIPLQGVEHILAAAAIVGRRDPDVRFTICGSGQTYPAMRELASRLRLTNVDWVERRPPAALAELIAGCDVTLGIFGGGPKPRRVIPNKVFEALACRRAVISADTPAIREAIVHDRHAFLCPPADPAALADAILHLRDDPAARERIAAAGHELFMREFSLDALSRVLSDVVLGIVAPRER